MKVLVVDDDSLARERLVRLLQQQDPVTACRSVANGHEALHHLTQDVWELVLMEVRLPSMSGIEVAQQLAKLETPPAIVFCTAFEEYALQAFQVKASGYLLKPITPQALTKLLWQVTRLNQAQRSQLVQVEEATLVVRDGPEQKRIPLTEVYYCRAQAKQVVVACQSGNYRLTTSLTQLLQQHPVFIAIHRHTLVNRTRLEALVRQSDGLKVRLRGVEELQAVSRRYAARLRSLFG